MKRMLEQDLQDYYGLFKQAHQQRREQLINSLAQSDSVPTTGYTAGITTARRRVQMPYAVKAALALAAGLLLVLGVWLIFNGSDNSLTSPQAAWAAAMEQARRVQSVHFRISAPADDKDSAAQMWWRRPNDFRMELPQMIMAGDGESMYIWNGKSDTVIIRDGGKAGAGPEMFILGNLGRLFVSEDDKLYRQWIDNSEFVSGELINYKGQPCRRIKCVYQGRAYEYIIEARAENDTVRPFLEVKEYSDREAKRLLSHMEVLSVDEEMPDSLFVIEPRPGQKVMDRRTR